MKLLKISLIILILPLLTNLARADNSQDCHDLFSPIENMAHSIKSRGGTWALFEKRDIYRKYAVVGLHVDSKITSLIYTINHVCEAQDGIPMNDLASQVVPKMKELGLEKFLKYYISLSYPVEEVRTWAVYADYFEAHHQRKLDFSLTQKTIEKSKEFFLRYVALDHKIISTNDVEGVAREGNAIIEEIKQFHATDPILIQVNAENAKKPHASTLLEIADEM
jgi:hypothetical protein